MGQLRSFLLSALPKTLISRLTGFATRIPLPRGLRGPFYRAFARRYGVALGDVDRELVAFASLAEFFARPLRAGARPLATGSELVWPCDGKIVSAGALDADRLLQVKGQEYTLHELLQDESLAAALVGGSQATIYLAPGDYHRVHMPFAGVLAEPRRIRGSYFPVNPPAVQSVAKLFARNARVVFPCTLRDGRRAAVVMVAALNVGDIRTDAVPGKELARGAELGRFGFGSTVVALVAAGGPGFCAAAPETVVRQGGAADAR